jgi:hypothetical protein
VNTSWKRLLVSVGMSADAARTSACATSADYLVTLTVAELLGSLLMLTING